MGESIWAKARGNVAAIYVAAGVLTWPVVTLLIYWGDRFANGMTAMGAPPPAAPPPAISFWAAGGYSLLISLLIMIAGWLQSSHKT